MKNLNKLQDDFINSLYENDQNILPLIKENKIKKEKLLNIYRNNLFCNLRNALKLTFPSVLEVLKEKKFNEISNDFIKNNRSKSGNLDNYGKNFYEIFEDELLRDLTIKDWFFQEAYLAKNDQILDIKKLQKINPQKLYDLKFQLSNSCFLINSKYNLNTKKLLKNSAFFVIFRQKNIVKMEKISKKEFLFLNGVKENLTLFEIYEKYNCNLEKNIQKFINNAILCDFKLELNL